jgi:predicted ThiF/HesA family dinucleotide-utilizing enzyme
MESINCDLVRALARIANSEVRPRRSGLVDICEVERLQLTAQLALEKVHRQKNKKVIC